MNLEKKLKLIAENINKDYQKNIINKPILLIGSNSDFSQRKKLKNYLLKISPEYQIDLIEKKFNSKNKYYFINLYLMKKIIKY